MLALLILPLFDPRLHGLGRRLAGGARGAQQRRAARLLGDPLRLHLRRRQQRLGLRRPDRQHASGKRHPRACDAARALLRDLRCWRWRARWPPRKRPPAPAPSRPTAPLFVGLLVGVILIVGALTFFPALALGPDRRALPDDAGHAVLRRTSDDGMRTTSNWARHAVRLFDRAVVLRAPRCEPGFRQARPAHAGPQPGHFVAEIGAMLTTVSIVRAFDTRESSVVRVRRSRLALVHGAVRQLRRGASPKGAARRRPTRCARARRTRRPSACVDDTARRSCRRSALQLQGATWCWSRPAT